MSVVDVLEAHLKQNIRGCMCGWAEIGRSHTVHVADELSKAGYGDLGEFEKRRKYDALSSIRELGSDDPSENPYRSNK